MPRSSESETTDRTPRGEARDLARRALRDDLARRIEGDVRVDLETRETYSTASGAYAIEPLAVVSPRDEGDCRTIVTFLAERGIPIVARGAGTGMGGHNVGSGVIVDFTAHMNRVVDPGADDGSVRVQPGIVRDALNESLRAEGRFFAPDPSSTDRCTVGGMIANNAGGLRTPRYGSTKHHVEALRVILPDGSAASIERAGRPGAPRELDARFDTSRDAISRFASAIAAEPPGPPKHASGYDVWGHGDTFDPVRLLVGSEGTLGLITEAVVRTEPIPPATGVLLVALRDIAATGLAIPAILDRSPSALELMDRTLLDAVRRVGLSFEVPIPDETESLLLVEVLGDDSSEVRDRLDEIASLLDDEHLSPCLMRLAVEPDEQRRLWGMRKSSSPILSRRTDGKKTLQIVEDGGVEPARVGEYLTGIRGIFTKHDIEVVAFGHAGNGNIHVNPFFDVSRPDFPRQVRRVAEEVTDLLIRLGGTLTAEHGDGRVRAPYLARRFPRLAPLFGDIKRIFDPEGGFNPGVIVPLPGQSVEQNLRYPSKES